MRAYPVGPESFFSEVKTEKVDVVGELGGRVEDETIDLLLPSLAAPSPSTSLVLSLPRVVVSLPSGSSGRVLRGFEGAFDPPDPKTLS